MRARVSTTAAIALTLALAASGVATGAAVSSAEVAQVRAVYRSVFTAEYFGPASAVCSRLTRAAVKSYTAGGARTCAHAFQQQQYVLRHKIKGLDNSGYTPGGWLRLVNFVMAHLKVSVHGARATAVGGQFGIPNQTKLVKVKGRWLFSTYPPSIEP